MKLQETHKYDDIIHLSRPRSGRRAEMNRCDRAAQFSPFAALTGFDAAIRETGRLTDQRIELDEDENAQLDEQMNKVLQIIHTCPEITVTWFRYDERKAGGTYVVTTGHVKKVDTYIQRMIFSDGQTIPLGEIFSIAITG